MDYIPEILQARILEWVAILFSRGSSQARDRTQVSCIASGFFTSWAPRETQSVQTEEHIEWREWYMSLYKELDIRVLSGCKGLIIYTLGNVEESGI